MSKNMIGHLQIPALCVVLGLASACSTVTPEQLSAVDAKATSAMSDARTAATNAANALKTAQAAQEAATAAQATADSAKSTAEAAMACCNENKDRIERMFEKVMNK
jgi:hypothetical protein